MEKGRDAEEVLVIDDCIPDLAHQMKAIYPFKYNGEFSPDALPLTMIKRPEEEQSFVETAASTSLYDKIAVGLVSVETSKGQAQGTSFNLTPPVVNERGISVSANHNLKGYHRRMASTVHGGRAKLVDNKSWMALEVLARGSETLPEEWQDINLDFSSPQSSPQKGFGQLSENIDRSSIVEDLTARLEVVHRPMLGDSDVESGSETSSWLEDQADADREVEQLAAASRTEMHQGKGRAREPRGQKTKHPKRGVAKTEQEKEEEANRKLAADTEADEAAELAARRAFKEKERAFREHRAAEAAKKGSKGPDVVFVEHAWNQPAVELSNTFFVMDPDEPKLAHWIDGEGWKGGDNMVGQGCPAQEGDEDYFCDVYDMNNEIAREYANASKNVYLDHLKGASPGKAIGVTDNALRVTCSFMEGSSGSVISKEKTPLAAVAIHVRLKKENAGGLFSASNVAVKVNSPWVVLHYGKLVVPRLLQQLKPGVWPKHHEKYMKAKLSGYLLRHKGLLAKHGMWGDCERLLKQLAS